jgi:hypothetical protein
MGEAVTHAHHRTGGPAPDGATWASLDPRESSITSPDGRIVPLLPSIPPTDHGLRSELAAAQRQIQSLTAELGIMSSAYHALSKHADEARIRERLEAKELEVTRLELDLAKARSELETLSAAYGDLIDPPGELPNLIDRSRMAWAVLTGARTLPLTTP